VAATLVDLLVVAPFVLAGAVLIGAATEPGDSTDTAVLALGILGYVAGVAVWAWDVLLRQGRTGASLGKTVLGIRLVAEPSGEPLGPGRTLVRAVTHLLDALPCYLGYLWPLWDARRRTFADRVIGTVVLVGGADAPSEQRPARD
jgi:uncharacterized RDD family membrane protein YckC